MTAAIKRILCMQNRPAERAAITARLAHRLAERHHLGEKSALRQAVSLVEHILDIGAEGFDAIEATVGSAVSE